MVIQNFPIWAKQALGAAFALAVYFPAQTFGDAPNQPNRATSLVIGRVSENPKKHFPGLEAMVRYLAKRLSSHGIESWEVVVARDNSEMLRLMRNGAVDIASETLLSAIQFIDEGKMDLLLLEWKKGVARYKTVFVTRQETEIRNLSDLGGKKIAFEDRGSTSSFFVPSAILVESGLRLQEITSPSTRPRNSTVGYWFAETEFGVASAVETGRVDAGALSDQDWVDPVRIPPVIKKRLRIFHESPPILRSLLLARADLPRGIKEAIKSVLTKAHKDPEGKSVLKKYNKVAKYDESDAVTATDLEFGRQVLEIVRTHLGGPN